LAINGLRLFKGSRRCSVSDTYSTGSFPLDLWRLKMAERVVNAVGPGYDIDNIYAALRVVAAQALGTMFFDLASRPLHVGYRAANRLCHQRKARLLALESIARGFMARLGYR
jgi:hypothetical protein